MKKQRGFIPIPILIAIIAGVLVLGGAGYVGVKQYQDYQVEKAEQERVAIEKGQETRALAEDQQKAIEQAQAEIEKLKQENKTSKGRQEALEQKVIAEQQKPRTQDYSISATELQPYLTGVVELSCFAELPSNKKVSGSGFLWHQSGLVITNQHVAFDKRCIVSVDDLNGKTIYAYEASVEHATLNKTQDFAILKLGKLLVEDDSRENLPPINYDIGNLKNCPSEISLGSSMVVIGYPAFAETETEIGIKGYGLNITESNRSLTNGVVSAYDNSATPPLGNLSNPHYFVSAKIDSGNSGGIAISKTSKGLCLLGIPTWLTLGNYETGGLVQNMNNIMSSNQ